MAAPTLAAFVADVFVRMPDVALVREVFDFLGDAGVQLVRLACPEIGRSLDQKGIKGFGSASGVRQLAAGGRAAALVALWRSGAVIVDADSVLHEAARCGHHYLFPLCRHWGAIDIDSATYVAADAGQIRSLCLLRRWAVDSDIDIDIDYGSAAYGAATRGRERVLRTFRQWGVISSQALKQVAIGAAWHGWLHILDLAIEWWADTRRTYILRAGQAPDEWDHQDLMALACNEGHEDIIQRCRELGAHPTGSMVRCLSIHGHERLIRLMWGWGCAEYNEVAAWAARKGNNTSLVLEAKQRGATKFTPALEHALRGGHEDLAATLHEWALETDPPPDYASLLEAAAGYKGSPELMQRVREWGAARAGGPDWVSTSRLRCTATTKEPDVLNAVLRYAASVGNTRAVALAIEWGGTDIEGAFDQATSQNHTETMEYLVDEHWASNIDEVVADAEVANVCILPRRLATLRLLKSWGATVDADAMLLSATSGRHGHDEGYEMAVQAREWGARNFDAAMASAGERGSSDLVQLMRSWGATALDRGMAYAARGGIAGLVRQYWQWGARESEWARMCVAQRLDDDAYEDSTDMYLLVCKQLDILEGKESLCPDCASIHT